MIVNIHMVVYTWWCWHIYKGDEVGVDVDQLGDETEARRVRNSTGGVSVWTAGVLRPVNGDRQRAGIGHRPDAGARSDRTLIVCV